MSYLFQRLGELSIRFLELGAEARASIEDFYLPDVDDLSPFLS